jgi:hypothetical protein
MGLNHVQKVMIFGIYFIVRCGSYNQNLNDLC